MLKIGSNINEVRIDGNLEALRQDLAAFQAFGLQAAEIGVHGTDVIKNGRLDRRRLAEVTEILDEFPFSYSVHAPNPLNLMDEEEFELQLEVLQATLAFASAIGAKIVVYHPGRFQAEESFGPLGKLEIPEAKQLLLLDLEAANLRRVAADYPGVTIAMENARPYLHHSPYCYAERIDRLKLQVERIDRPNVGICLDFGHLHMAARYYGFDAVAAVREVAPLIRHCHVHDNFGRAVYHSEKQQTHQIPLGKGDSHMPVGWGSIDFPPLLASFISKYQGLLIIELRGRYFAATGDAAKNLESLLKQSQSSG